MFLTALAWKRLMQGRDGLSLYGRVNNAMETLFCCHTVHVSRSHVAQWPILSKLVESRGGFSEAPDSFCRGCFLLQCQGPREVPLISIPSDCAMEHTAPSDSPKFTLQALQHPHKLGGRLFLHHFFLPSHMA